MRVEQVACRRRRPLSRFLRFLRTQKSHPNPSSLPAPAAPPLGKQCFRDIRQTHPSATASGRLSLHPTPTPSMSRNLLRANCAPSPFPAPTPPKKMARFRAPHFSLLIVNSRLLKNECEPLQSDKMIKHVIAGDRRKPVG